MTQANLNEPSIRATRDSLETSVSITQLWVLCLHKLYCGCGVVELSSTSHGEVHGLDTHGYLFLIYCSFLFLSHHLNTYDHPRKPFSEKQGLPFLVFKSHLELQIIWKFVEEFLIDLELIICYPCCVLGCFIRLQKNNYKDVPLQSNSQKKEPWSISLTIHLNAICVLV